MKIYNVNRISSDEYLAGLDSAWDSISLAYKACDLQNKYYSDILKAHVFEMEVKTKADFEEYMKNVVDNHKSNRKKLMNKKKKDRHAAKVL
jgi:hypothetical protein